MDTMEVVSWSPEPEAYAENAQTDLPMLTGELAQVLREALALWEEQLMLDAETFRAKVKQGVEATNNRAKRTLLPAVIVRKRGGCNKTAHGACTYAVLASVLQTMKQQGRGALEHLASVLTASGERPKILSPP